MGMPLDLTRVAPEHWPSILAKEDALSLYVALEAANKDLAKAKQRVKELERDLALAGDPVKQSNKIAKLTREVNEQRTINNLWRNHVRNTINAIEPMVLNGKPLVHADELRSAVRSLRAMLEKGLAHIPDK